MREEEYQLAPDDGAGRGQLLNERSVVGEVSEVFVAEVALQVSICA